MRIVICDDDSLVINQMEKLIKLFFDKNRIKTPDIATFSNGTDLLADTGEKDILFLDIEMPGMNGIYVGKEIKKMSKNTLIFVVTSYAEYLDDAMRFHVFRYLSKPLDRQRFFRNLRDALEYYYRTTPVKIPVETKEGLQVLQSSAIIAIEAQLRKVIVHTLEQDFVSIHNMDYWIKQLPQNYFFQSHRSFIVNFEHITDFDHSTIHLANGEFCAYLTKRKYKSFKDAYLLYLESTR